MNAKEITILGTPYMIMYDCEEESLPEGSDGCMDHCAKIIKILKMSVERDSVQNIDEYKKNVLRHEIIHAFFFESGVWSNSGCVESWGQDETITDWFAIQSPKIFDAFKEAGCL